MPDWHGYPQAPDTHPTRPWWRLWRSMHQTGWRRYAWDGTSPVVEDLDVPADWNAEEYEADIEARMAEVDRRYPVPPPPPKCGQVWVSRRDEALVTHVIPQLGAEDSRWTLRIGGSLVTCGADCVVPWPPPGAVLVAGPYAPWAPREGAP